MAKKPDTPAAAVPAAGYTVLGTVHAPFIYFDAAAAFGQNSGSIQLELFANALIPDGIGGIETRVVTTAHIRCSANAAMSLRQAIDGVLAMISQTEPVPDRQKN